MQGLLSNKNKSLFAMRVIEKYSITLKFNILLTPNSLIID